MEFSALHYTLFTTSVLQYWLSTSYVFNNNLLYCTNRSKQLTYNDCIVYTRCTILSARFRAMQNIPLSHIKTQISQIRPTFIQNIHLNHIANYLQRFSLNCPEHFLEKCVRPGSEVILAGHGAAGERHLTEKRPTIYFSYVSLFASNLYLSKLNCSVWCCVVLY